ncbi:MAG: hypothetical protein H6629_05060 [Calditrichae bacterium]|nr:hypothetical protein [Calditrichia bacterium]
MPTNSVVEPPVYGETRICEATSSIETEIVLSEIVPVMPVIRFKVVDVLAE